MQHWTATVHFRRLGWLLPIVLVVLCFAPLLDSPLLYDDGHAVADNQALRSLGNLPRFFVDPALFSSTGSRMYRPLVLVALAIDHALGGGAAWVFKPSNML
jgi:hypothetical protein